MAQSIKIKDLINTRLANNYGGWIYCDSCNQTIGYLCYVTYQSIELEYTCKCGSHGSIRIIMDDDSMPIHSDEKLISIKNRLCCPNDGAPLMTILNQKLDNRSYKIICKNCNQEYNE